MDMQTDLFADCTFGQIALEKIKPANPNFRLYSAGWLETGDTAVQQFTQTARHDYPDYSLIATLASPVPEAGRCESSI